jgi:hypothetical protein
MLIKMTQMVLAGALVVGAASTALAGGRTNNAFAYAPAGSNEHIARHYDSSDRAQVSATPRGTLCPTLEGYPDCH